MKTEQQKIIDAFHILYYENRETWLKSDWLGKRLHQCPMDMWAYQEIIYETRPEYIVQTGVNRGGSLLFFASMFDLLQYPRDSLVIGIDIKLLPSARALHHPRIRMIEGSSVDEYTVQELKTLVGNSRRGMVSLDSDHRKDHIVRELSIYKDFVDRECYLVVEDTNLNGNPVKADFGSGPHEAVQQFLSSNRSFLLDTQRADKLLLSFHKHGWLKRIN